MRLLLRHDGHLGPKGLHRPPVLREGHHVGHDFPQHRAEGVPKVVLQPEVGVVLHEAPQLQPGLNLGQSLILEGHESIDGLAHSHSGRGAVRFPPLQSFIVIAYF